MSPAPVDTTLYADAPGQDNKSSLLFELDVHLHVDSGRCVLHPRLPPTPQQQQSTSKKTQAFEKQWHISSSIGLSQEDTVFQSYLSRYKRHLSLDPLLKPTDISVFYMPAVDVGVS